MLALAAVTASLLLLTRFGTHGSSLEAAITAISAAVTTAATVATAWLAYAAYRDSRIYAGPVVPTWPSDSSVVAVEVTRVLLGVDAICRGDEPYLDDGEDGYIRAAVERAKVVAAGDAAGEFSDRLRSLGFEPSLLIRSLPGYRGAASAWAAADAVEDRDWAPVLGPFRRSLLQDLAGNLASDQYSRFSPNTVQFFREARDAGENREDTKREEAFSQRWVLVLPQLNARLGKPDASSPRTEADQARASCRIPPADKYFTGRSGQIKRTIARVAREMRTSRSRSAVALITGQPGVGASALTVEIARGLEGRALFPGGVFYFNLNGLAITQPVTAEDVAQEVLTIFGANSGGRPLAAYAAALQGKQVLLVLDNAADNEHVQGLVQQISSCCVLVTSRTRIGSHVDFDRTVDPLPRLDSIALLLKYAGDRPEDGWPASVRRSCGKLAKYCDDHPIALRAVGAQMKNQTPASLDEYLSSLVKELEGEPHRLGRLADVSDAIRHSYERLSDYEKRLLRMCHTARAHDVTSTELAYCLGPKDKEGDVERGLARLVDANLARSRLKPTSRFPLVTYSLFDLVRLFAAQLRSGEESVEPTAEFIRRYIIYMQARLAALSQDGVDADAGTRAKGDLGTPIWHLPGDAFRRLRDDPRLTRDQVPIIAAVELALDNKSGELGFTLGQEWHEIGISLARDLNEYLMSAGFAYRTTRVDGLLVDFYLRREHPAAAVRTRLDASVRLREAGRFPDGEKSLLKDAIIAADQALALAQEYHLGEFTEEAEFAVSEAAAELEQWERNRAGGQIPPTPAE
jgi:hypothetical protein